MGNMFESEVENIPDTWSTPSLALAAWLMYCNHRVMRFDTENGQGHWVFRETDDLIDDVMLFTSGDALVEPTRYSATLKKARRYLARAPKHGAA